MTCGLQIILAIALLGILSLWVAMWIEGFLRDLVDVPVTSPEIET